MVITYRIAAIEDLSVSLELVQEFHLEERLPFNASLDRPVLADFLSNPNLGRMWLIEERDEVLGYILVTFGYSLEFRGRDAFIDEFYLRSLYRRQGIGTQTLAFAEDACRDLGIKALHLEADFKNPDAQRLYNRTGYAQHDRVLMTKLLTEMS
ncbi:MAG TPA: GNAT family N-acetyltransferase [Leptolyngbyaceae cyanobacterium M33_DOE_097]|uniref:GNAT family N-acetyltransferase n=1 Tax=Oscillatoriales cyanobacterium SpSt-418 TaxID=2282169 RepID=A0A7C3PJJ4_9CYAN|nr:GNAT family N-acetyltransferase [Leptolyngbyaceae cyanobacterium M33_DOE_097]